LKKKDNSHEGSSSLNFTSRYRFYYSPPSLEEKTPQDSPNPLVNQVVEDLGISSLLKTCKGGGTSSYPPHLMFKVLFSSYLSNIYSSRKIAKQVQESIHNMYLAELPPSPTRLDKEKRISITCGWQGDKNRPSVPSTTSAAKG
jgi:transposase